MKLIHHLEHFYKKYQIPDLGGVNDKMFDVPLPLFTLKLPNFNWRRNMLHIHDLEHILHNQDTTWAGEVYIASWEISTGFLKSFPVIFLPLWTMGFGLWYRPKAVLNGFKRGNSDVGIANLNFKFDQLMDMELEQLMELTLNKRVSKCKLAHSIRLICWIFTSQLIFLLPAIVLIIIVLFTV